MRLFLLFSLGLALACSGSTPLAHYTVSDVQGDESCSKLLDYCIRTRCVVKNDSPVPGQAVIDLQLVDGAGTHFTQTERVDLGPGDQKTLTHDFTEAKLLGNHDYQVQCVLR